jgi:hypothetical protein
MVRLWGGRAIRWGLLALAGLILVVFFGRLIFQLEGRLRVESKGRQKAEAALAVDEAKLSTRDNLHVMVTVPPPSVTVTVAPGGTTQTISPGAQRVITAPSPFAVPGASTTVTVPPAKPPIVEVQNCPVLHLLIICL